MLRCCEANQWSKRLVLCDGFQLDKTRPKAKPEFLPTQSVRWLWLQCQRNKVAPHSECKWNHRNLSPWCSEAPKSSELALASGGHKWLYDCYLFFGMWDRLSWLPVSFWVRTNSSLPYRIVSATIDKLTVFSHKFCSFGKQLSTCGWHLTSWHHCLWKTLFCG